MKKVLSSITISFLLIFIAGCTIVHNPAPAPTQTVDVKKENKRETTANQPNLEIKHFTNVKVGNPSLKRGINELTVVDQNFPALNTTKVIPTGTKTAQGGISVTENLDINVNVQNFSHISENYESWIKPGQIFRALSFISDKPTPVEIPRNPITLGINLPGVANSSYKVQNPELNSQLLQAERYLIAQNAKPSPTNISFSFHKIHSVEEMEFKLTGKYRAALASFSGECGLKAGNQQQYHFYMLEFKQHMLSIQANGMLPSTVFKQPVNDMSDYVYIDQVNYGRKGVIIFKSTRTLEELGITAAANFNTGMSEGSIRTICMQLSGKKEVQSFARFYGGSSLAAIQTMENTVKKGVPDIVSYIRSQTSNHQLALPIGYTLKNMDNQVVGQKSNKRQTVVTTTPKTVNNQVANQKSNQPKTVTTTTSKPVVSIYKLKVTLTDIQCINSRDFGDNPDDYGIQQYIVYSALGKDKKFVSRDINKFPGQIDKVKSHILNPLINGDLKHQIHVREDGDVKQRNRNMISNSLVFHVTANELKDLNASFKIFTWLIEYTKPTMIRNTGNKVLMNNESIKVKVKDVIEILSGSKGLNATSDYHDLSIGKGVKFHNFGSGFMHLANIQKITPMVLEGPIRVGKPGEKAAVWIQFELIE